MDEVTRTLIGCPTAAERQKIGFDPIATERQLRRNGRWKQQWRNGFFSRKQRNSYGIYETATAEWQRNGMVETRHETSKFYRSGTDLILLFFFLLERAV